MPFDVVLIALSLVLALGLTLAVRTLARRWGLVARPKSDRWHKKPTALLGGVAIFISVTMIDLMLPHTPQALAVTAAGALLFTTGLVDDLVHLRPYQKLIGQLLGAGLVVGSGLVLPWTGSILADPALTVFWLVGITNGLNLLDNMDGLAAGIAAIAGVFLAVDFLNRGQRTEGLRLLVFTAVLLGYLVYNAPPASIFMGDAGSLFLGIFLASAAVQDAAENQTSDWSAAVAVPVLILLLPIFDTTLVTILRKRAGRPVSQGGRDHTSHRLVRWGLSERKALGILYGMAFGAGCLALMVPWLEVFPRLVLLSGVAAGMILLGLLLARVQVYEQKRSDK